MSVVADTRVTSTGQAIDHAAIVYGVVLEGTGTAGQIVVKDGTASGTTKIDVGTAAAAGPSNVSFEGGGVRFTTDVHVSTLSNIDGATFIYRDVS